MSELPSGWAFAALNDLCKQPEQRVPQADEVFTYIDIASIDRDLKVVSEPQQLLGANAPSRARKLVEKGDVIVSMTRPNLNAVALIGEQHNGCIASTGFDVLKPIEVEPRWIFSAVRSARFVDAMCEKVQGALYPAVKSTDIREYEIPLPPLAEQKRIAQKLDQLLTQVDTLKARIDAIPALLKRFRQSVLAAAVSGQLTEEWRAINPSLKPTSIGDVKRSWSERYQLNGRKYKEVDLLPGELGYSLPESWVEAKVGEIFDVYVGATPSREKPEFWEGSIPWVSSSEVAFCRIKNTKELITETGYKSASTSIHPTGTVMLAMIGQGKTRGQPAILDIEACHNQNTAAIRVNPDFCIPEYLYYYLYERYEETRRVGSGNNQQALNKKAVQSLPFPLPPRAEQSEIVRQVEKLFAFADQLEAKVSTAQTRIDRLTQSILAKAFRGELVPQDPNDEPASVLLERIRTQRAAAPTAKRGRKAQA